MTAQTNIPVYTDEEDKKMIERASKIVGLNSSAFCRTSAIREARKILLEVQKETDNKNIKLVEGKTMEVPAQ